MLASQSLSCCCVVPRELLCSKRIGLNHIYWTSNRIGWSQSKRLLIFVWPSVRIVAPRWVWSCLIPNKPKIPMLRSGSKPWIS
ncbi:hypothetical protein BN2476_650038 [Paraburkholderia piptadeniae]|uniref:Uncharacterized protein n=1 Tax=Paraburkholderia piptadeniae TaxID=1701573 RepID=A0A1N7SN73_9BURK|nr:hypothetical protein BN2476_650038 [Paraburkholderia piptadeniae]